MFNIAIAFLVGMAVGVYVMGTKAEQIIMKGGRR